MTVSPYAKQLTIAAGRSSTRLTFCTPSEEPPDAGLTISGSPSRATMRESPAPAPSSRKVLWGRATQSGVGTPAPLTTDLAAGLSQARRQAAAGDPTYG